MAGIDTISAQQLDDYYQENVVFIIDLRSPKEYLKSHYFGALNLPYEDFDEIEHTILGCLPKEGTMILYCDRGSASLMAARELMKKGYQVKSVVGGIHAYSGSNLYFSPMHSKIKKNK